MQGNTETSLHHEHIELLTFPPKPTTNRNAAVTSTDNLGYNDDEADICSFTTDHLFSFAWQIARGMVMYMYNQV